jgi:hypothetical protein
MIVHRAILCLSLALLISTVFANQLEQVCWGETDQTGCEGRLFALAGSEPFVNTVVQDSPTVRGTMANAI